MSISNVLRASFSVGCVVLAAAAVAIPAPARSAEPVAEVRLYALDCGAADFKDMSFFSDTGEYDGKAGSVVVPCFVVRHPKGTLMWDTGLGDKLAETKGGADVAPGIHARVDHPLMEQLKALGLTPADVTFVAFSHFHFDHTGNANAFAASTWIVNKAEAAWAQGPNPPGVAPESISALKTVKTQMIDGDHDVFGDGTVRILRTPGHTPGHQVLMVKLAKSGTVILSGDLYHIRDNRKFQRVPMINVDRADTLASMNRIEKIVANTKARFVIQHDPGDFKALPKFPAYLQ
ncbi:MAG TPA: N-acyl homoserine lactonase family protein [Haliangiales bacterium]|nr:N-acyl homoserine lactonase family protein [Haliangiales bacterium]